jgi:hypothetical protein
MWTDRSTLYLGGTRFKSRPLTPAILIVFSWFSSVPLGECFNCTSIRPQAVSSRFFPIQCSSIYATFVRGSLATADVIK